MRIRMEKLLKKIIPIRSNEVIPFIYCFVINFCLGLSFVLGSASSEALFLKEFGARYLPLMFVVNAVAIIVLFPIYDSLTEKFSANKIFYILSLIFASLLIPAAILLILKKPPAFIYPLLFSISVISSTFFYLHYYTYLVDFFNTLQTKRLLPYIFISVIIGTIIGGFTIPSFLKIAGGTSFIIIIWAGLFAVVCLLVFFNSKNITFRKAAVIKRKDKGFLFRFCQQLKIIKKSYFIKITLLTYFIGDLTITGGDIIAQTIFAELSCFPDAESLAGFYGLMGGYSAILVLLFQYIILPHLIRYMGVTTLNLLLPILCVIGFAGMSIAPFLPILTLPFAIFIRFNAASASEYLEPVASNLILSALEPMQKKKMLSFYGGFAEPIGPIVIGLLLTGLANFLTPVGLIPFFIILAVGYVALSVWQNRLYTKELINLINDKDISLFKAASESLVNINPKVLEALKNNLRQPDGYKSLISAQIIADIQGVDALPQFINIMPEVSPALQSEILQIFARLGQIKKDDFESKRKDAEKLQDNSEILYCINDFLSDDVSKLRQRAISAMDILDSKDRFADEIIPLISSYDPGTACLAAVYCLNRNSCLQYHEKCMILLEQVLLDEDRKITLAAVNALGELRNDSFDIIEWALSLFKGKQVTQKNIANVLIKLLKKSTNEHIWRLFSLQIREVLINPIREVRLFALKALQKIDEINEKDIEHIMGDRFDKIRHAVRSSICANEEILNKTLITGYYGKDNRFRWESKLILEAQRRIKAHSGETTELVYTALMEAGNALNRLVCLEKSPYINSFPLLKEVLQDQFYFKLKTAIALIEFIGKDDAFAAVKKSLESNDAFTQASAIETLENLPGKNIGKITALLEPMTCKLPDSEKMELIKSVANFPAYVLEDVLLNSLNTDDPWEKEIALHAINTAKEKGAEFSTKLFKPQ
ncbi:ATP:ADP antiporter, AAA family [Candidatus Magnetomoraceae bacterium gMMP-13]